MINYKETLIPKKYTVLALVLAALVGSFVTFYATNLILSDVSNMFYMGISQDIITSIPIFLFAVDFVVITFFVNRMYIRPQYTRKTFAQFMDWLTLVSMVGCVATVVTGAFMYGRLSSDYPFKNACTICLIIHMVMFLGSTFLSTFEKDIPQDPEKKKYSAQYIIYTIFLVILVFFAYNRFGALLWAPVYAQRSSLYLTWPFYVSLALPMLLLFYIPIVGFDLDRKNRWFTVFYVSAIIILNFIFAALVFIRGRQYPLFISAISPALGIERLLTKPVDVIVQFALCFLLGVYALRYSIRRAMGKSKKSKFI